MRFGAHARVSTSVHRERRQLRGRVDVVVVGKLSRGKELVPVVLAIVAPLAKVGLDLYIDSFRLAVCLGVVGGGCANRNAQQTI